MIGITPGSTASTTLIQQNDVSGAQQAAPRAGVVPTVSELLGGGVSAAFGLQAPPDTANLEVLIDQVVAEFEKVQAELDEQKAIQEAEEVRSIRSALLAALGQHDDIVMQLEALEGTKLAQEEQQTGLETQLTEKRAELQSLPHDTPLDPEDEDSELGPDPSEVARLTGEISGLETQLTAVSESLTETNSAISSIETDLATSSQVQALLYNALSIMARPPVSQEGEEPEELVTEKNISQISSELRAIKPEFDSRYLDIVRSEDRLRELADAEYALQVVGFIRETLGDALNLARDTRPSAAGTGGRVQLLLDNGSF